MELRKKYKRQQLELEWERISGKIQKQSFPSGFGQYVLYILGELFMNIIEHAEAQKIKLNIKVSKKKFHFSVSDDGKGIRKSYHKNELFPKDDKSAIEFALGGLSSKSGKERGFGFYSIRKLTEAINGNFSIASGNMEATISKNSILYRRMNNTIPGVAVNINSPVMSIDFYNYIK